MSYFASEYTIHFDDTMAYGSHHFLTAFKFQCSVREQFLFGERVFDLPGVADCLDRIHLFTGDAYSRNMNPAKLGERLAIFLSLEEWGQVSARFCYRVISEHGKPICAGFQTMICADAKTGTPILIPVPLRDAMDSMREIEEPLANKSFRDRVLQGGELVDELFDESTFATAKWYLEDRYPKPGVIPIASKSTIASLTTNASTIDGLQPNFDAGITETEDAEDAFETWVFSGQGSFDAELLSQRILASVEADTTARAELDACITIVGQLIEGNALALMSGSSEACGAAVRESTGLMQIAIFLQNVLGARLQSLNGKRPDLLMGHSFGEIAALCVAGSFDLATGVEIVCHRVLAVANHAPQHGELLVASTNRQQVSSEAAILGLTDVVVAGRNHDGQTVASGPAEQLSQLRDRFRTQEITSIRIDSPTSFHHPHLHAAASNWHQRIRQLAIRSPKEKVYSPIGRRTITDTDDVAATLASQFTRPFDLQGAIHDVVAIGGGRFVDCGSSGSLQRLLVNAGPEGINVRIAQFDSVATQPATQPATSTHSPHPSHAPGQTVVPTIAIVGSGCILPGRATSPEQLLSAIDEQRLGIVDQSTLDPHWLEDFYSAELVPDRSTSPLSGMVNDADIRVPVNVDADVFDSFTRTQQLLCIALAPCISALQDAKRVLCFVGSTADGLQDQDVVSSLRYADIDPTDGVVDGRLDTAGSAFEGPHSAIQEVFDRLVRPGLQVTLVDAACASSLYTVALGMQALESNEADAVVAGGVFCPGPGNSCLFSQFRGTTSTGCRPFDANADGVVFSEGSAMVVLRRLADAESTGVPVTAIVRGIGLSSDGKSSSANVPQTRGQILALQRCYANYAIDPSSVDAVEAHGTSTPVGDSTEVNTLRDFFADHVSASIPIHSLKGLLGHAGWAAGTASIIATCEYLRSGFFPGQAFFRNPSQAVNEASGTLHVTTEPTELSQGRCRIAVDGFGFGGANAHVVVERYQPNHSPAKVQVAHRDRSDDLAAELVCVAMHRIQPTDNTPTGKRFNRDSLRVPKHHVLLPDLADDMDASQTLAIALLDQTIAQIPNFDEQLRKQTSVVLALSGKTERGIEATMRVLAPRLIRELAGTEHIAKIEAGTELSRPSGPYTLQCMMPNVSSGRAALQMNLNGPNFVVDAGQQSFDAALHSAGLLLRSGAEGGSKLVVVAAIDANLWQTPTTNGMQRREDECAAAFAITTRRNAEELGLTVLSTVLSLIPDNQSQTLLHHIDATASEVNQQPNSTSHATNDSKVSARVEHDEFPIHVPVWVERPLTLKTNSATPIRSRVLTIVRGDAKLVEALSNELGSVAEQSLIAVVGPRSREVVAQLDQQNLLPIDLSDSHSTKLMLDRIADFAPDCILGLEPLNAWELESTLTKVATDNELCEFIFLVAKQQSNKLQLGELELWGLFPGGWKDTIHPATGATVGLLKAIRREAPNARVGVISTREDSLRYGLACLQAERSQNEIEQEIVYDGDVRLARRLRPALHQDSNPQVDLKEGSVVIATGGARGVTAVLMDALLRDYGCKVIALGRSAIEPGPAHPDDPEVERDYYETFLRENPGASPSAMKQSFASSRARWEAHQTIQKLASLGEVRYLQADVTNPEEVARVIEVVAEKFGRVDLLVHGAGVQYSKRLEDRTLEEFRRTFGVKVVGLHNMVEAIRNRFGHTVSSHVLTSAYSVFGNDGQHDYGAANETMDRLCGLTELHSDHAWSSVAWLAWDGVGMTRGSEYRALAKQRGLSGLNVESGQRVFRAAYQRHTNAAINVPMSLQEHVKYEVPTIPKAARTIPTTRIREVPVRLAETPCLPFHFVQGTATLPGAWTLERMVSASLPLAGDSRNVTSVSMRDVTFNRFVKFAHDIEPRMRVVVEASEQTDHVEAWVIGDVVHPTGVSLSRDVIFAHATISFITDTVPRKPKMNGIGSLSSIHRSAAVLSDPYCTGKEINLSGPFDCIRNIQIGDLGRSAQFQSEQQVHWTGEIPSLLIDASLRIGGMYPNGEANTLCVPVHIGRIVAPTNMNASAESADGWQLRASSPTLSGQKVSWALTEVVDENGELKMTIEDAVAQRL